MEQFLGGHSQAGAHAVDVRLAGVKSAVMRREIAQLLEILESLYRIASEIDPRVRGDGVDKIVQLFEVSVGALDICSAVELLVDLDDERLQETAAHHRAAIPKLGVIALVDLLHDPLDVAARSGKQLARQHAVGRREPHRTDRKSTR